MSPHPQKTPCRCIDPGTCTGMAGCGEDLPRAAKAPAVPRWQCDIPQPEGLPCAPIFPVNICSTVPEMCSVKFASESSASILVIVFARTSLSPAFCSPGIQKGCVSYSDHEELEPNCTPAAPHTSLNISWVPKCPAPGRASRGECGTVPTVTQGLSLCPMWIVLFLKCIYMYVHTLFYILLW